MTQEFSDPPIAVQAPYWDATDRTWVVGRYADAVAILKSDEVGLAAPSREARQRLSARLATSIENLNILFGTGHPFQNEPFHAPVREWLRHLMADTARMWPAERMDRFVEAQFEVVEDGSVHDVVQLIAIPLPATVVGEAIGMTPENLRLCRDKLLPLHDFWHRDVYPLRELAEFERKAGEIVDLLRRVYGDERESEFARLAFLSIAGLVTTTSLLAGAMERLSREPELQDRLRAEPALLNGFVDEVLRFEPPARRMMSRSSTKKTVLSGTTVPGHTRMDVDLARVHRDPDIFADPDRFDATRKSQPLLIFGSGAHACVGAALARLEARVLLTRLMRDFDISPGGPAHKIEHRDFLGYESLPLRFTKRPVR